MAAISKANMTIKGGQKRSLASCSTSSMPAKARDDALGGGHGTCSLGGERSERIKTIAAIREEAAAAGMIDSTMAAAQGGNGEARSLAPIKEWFTAESSDRNSFSSSSGGAASSASSEIAALRREVAALRRELEPLAKLVVVQAQAVGGQDARSIETVSA